MSKYLSDDSILGKVLRQCVPEEELYKSYCQKELWTPYEFAALMGGLSPPRCQAILEGTATDITPEELKKIKISNQVLKKLFRRKVTEKKSETLKKDAVMTAWRFIKLAVLEEIPFRFGFFKHLPPYLMEIYLEFQPADVALRTSPTWSKRYHFALYKRRAEELLADNPRLTAREIYRRTKGVRDTFVNASGYRVSYAKRTITESWHPKIQKSPRGRPRKTS